MGNPFQKLRTAANLTQADVAKALDIEVQTVSAWERSISSPRADLWQKLAEAYSVSLTQISEAVVENSRRRPQTTRAA